MTANYKHACHANRGKPPIERFMEKVSPEPNSGCWLWTGCCDKNGYGFIRIAGKNIRTNRFSLEHHSGRTLGTNGALHTCDNPSCVNPEHLYAGDNRRNQIDVAMRGRASRLKLSPDQVREIRKRRKAGERPCYLAIEYGVHETTIVNIAHGQKWGHLQ